jgi:uncharacterized protein
MSPQLNEILLIATAALAGAINSVAGGGTLLTFPALYAALGSLPAAGVLANGTSTVALWPGSLAAAWGYRHDFRRASRWLAWLLAPSVLGGLVGVLLVVNHAEAFEALVPWLILTAAMLFALQPRISRWAREAAQSDSLDSPTAARHDHPSRRKFAAILAFQFIVSVYGGYFGAGIGILMLAALGLMGQSDIHLMNGVKNLCASCINMMAVTVFITYGQVRWDFALPMLVAAIAGGYAGAHLARRTNPALVRRAIVVIGFSLATWYFYRRLRG